MQATAVKFFAEGHKCQDRDLTVTLLNGNSRAGVHLSAMSRVQGHDTCMMQANALLIPVYLTGTALDRAEEVLGAAEPSQEAPGPSR